MSPLRQKGWSHSTLHVMFSFKTVFFLFLQLNVKTETALENHVKSHSGIRDLKCHICDAAFASRYTLNAHIKRHAITEPLFSCPYCGKGSKSKANLEQHIRIHTGVRPYSCNVCNAA